MKPSREWEKLGKFIIDAPFLGVNKGKYEQFQDLNNMISQKLIDYDWAEAQAHYNREEGADELGRQVARIVGIGKIGWKKLVRMLVYGLKMDLII